MLVIAGIGIAIAVAVGTVLTVKALIKCCGFRAAGVVAGSIASGIHSLIKVVAKGSCFAIMQSVGVLGLGVGPTVAIGSAAAAITLLAILL